MATEENKDAVNGEENKDKPGKSLREVLDTPLTQDEAQRLLADIDVQQAQLSVVRLRLLDQLNQVDLQLAQSSFDRSIIIRRTLNVEAGEEVAHDGSDS